MHFYQRVLISLKNRGLLKETDSILVVAGGASDRQFMMAAGFPNVTISNLDYHAGETQYAPYEWRRLDGENLELEDNSFDWAVIHAGLHHMAVPARGVCEMFRVARNGILCIEARDSFLMRIAIRLGLSAEHELEPAFLSGGTVGGYRNGPIPNYVYRWTEREFEKTLCSYAPTHQHTFFYDYGYSVPGKRFEMAQSPIYRLVGRLLAYATRAAEWVIPRQGNQFAFGALKNSRRQPWLTESLAFNDDYLNKKYDKQRYRSKRHESTTAVPHSS
jgi:ubiquinone/menaquinone biosynthesis C-methylase UbiE